jgi:RNA polymerase sigma-70 factor (ECF subfamily)
VDAVHADDLALARRAAMRDEEADILVRRLLPRIDRTVRLLVGGHEDAADLVQQCLLAILENLRSYRGTGSLEGWAGGVAYRVVMRQMKRTRRAERALVAIPGGIEARGPDPAGQSLSSEIGGTLELHVSRLPLERRTALVLHLVQGYTVSEVAGLTGAPENTIRDRLRVGLRELRRSLATDPAARELFAIEGEGHASP